LEKNVPRKKIFAKNFCETVTEGDKHYAQLFSSGTFLLATLSHFSQRFGSHLKKSFCALLALFETLKRNSQARPQDIETIFNKSVLESFCTPIFL
jgi:hypothetical protein